jgi:amidophosphoribosyltransferase
MCGIVGLISTESVNHHIYDALIALQHRGQDAAGMMTCEKGHFSLHKNNGLVRDVFDMPHMLRLKGNMGLGHVRYPTAGTESHEEAQPFYVNSPYGIALVHNGNLTNTIALAQDVFASDLRHLNTSSDSEVLLNVLAHELQSFHQLILTPETIFKAIESVYQRARGAYSVVAMIAGYGLLAFRDPLGIRPLIYGERQMASGEKEYMVASESVALDALGFKVVADLGAGEALYIDLKGKVHRQQCHAKPQLSPCIFEFVYLARPDSVIDGVSVHKVRLRMGEKLGEKILQVFPDHDIDVVIPIPDTSRTAALPLAQKLGVKYREGFVKNRYIGRTFIMPEQSKRRKSVRQKLNAIPLEFKGKNVLLVDDSIVRGTTCREIIQMARQAGARKVYFASAAPEVRYPNVYGIDMPCVDDLIAHDCSIEEMRQKIGADWLIFQDLEVLINAAQEGNADITRFESSVFTGEYITGDVDAAYLKKLAHARS